jgi:F-type H+-transporting ATPase subunit b
MVINWFTVIAQIVNFLILVWLLKRFLYKPILSAIDEREKGITAKLHDAELKKTEAEKQRSDLHQKNEAFDQQLAALMKTAVTSADSERLRLLGEARKDFVDLKAKQENTLKEEQQKIGKEIIRKTKNEVFAITRKTLSDLASVSLEEAMVNVFIQRLKADDKKHLTTAFKTSSNLVMIETAFNLPAEQQTSIENTVKQITGAQTQFQFKTLPELMSGIELTTGGYKLAWSSSDYVTSIEKNIAEMPVAV